MKIWWKRLYKFRELSFSEKLLLIKVFTQLIFFKSVLYIFPFKVSRKLISLFFNNIPQFYSPDKTKKELIITSIKRLVAVKFFNFTCLPQALTLKFNLRKNNAVKLFLGVRLDDESKFEFHAWIEEENKILIGEIDSINFQPLWDFN